MADQLTTTNERPTLRQLLSSDKMREQFSLALPSHVKPERFCRIALTCILKTPKLAECTQESVMQCLLDLSALGLEPDGRRAYLIPYKQTCTLIISWTGLAELAMRSGIIARLHADVVCENDEFEYSMGSVTKHVINFKADRGAPYAAYAMAETKDGAKFYAVMSKSEVDGIMKRSQGYKAAIQYNKSHPWLTDYTEMMKKTTFRRLAKWLPLSPEFREAIDKEDEQDFRDVRNLRPQQAAATEPLDPFNPPASLPAPETDPYVDENQDQQWNEEGSDLPPQ